MKLKISYQDGHESEVRTDKLKIADICKEVVFDIPNNDHIERRKVTKVEIEDDKKVVTDDELSEKDEITKEYIKGLCNDVISETMVRNPYYTPYKDLKKRVNSVNDKDKAQKIVLGYLATRKIKEVGRKVLTKVSWKIVKELWDDEN